MVKVKLGPGTVRGMDRTHHPLNRIPPCELVVDGVPLSIRDGCGVAVEPCAALPAAAKRTLFEKVAIAAV
jgi:hypothetical protein